MRKEWKEGSIRGQLVRAIMADVTATEHLGRKIQTGELRANPKEMEWRCPRKYVWEKIKRKNYTLEVHSPRKKEGDLWILQLHGGGYIGPMKNAYRNFAIKYSEVNEGATVVTPDYRVAPEHPFPAALKDCIDAYQWILAKGVTEEQIVVVGDSAGGGLTFALGHWLKKKKKKMPKAMITMSAWTDVTCSGSSYKENFDKDPLFGNTTESMLYRKDYMGDHDLKNPYISPIYGELTGFPPIHMQAGSYEMLLSDTEDFAKKAEQSGVLVEVVIFEGMFHVFPMAGALVPETKEAWKAIKNFFDRIYEREKESDEKQEVIENFSQ